MVLDDNNNNDRTETEFDQDSTGSKDNVST